MFINQSKLAQRKTQDHDHESTYESILSRQFTSIHQLQWNKVEIFIESMYSIAQFYASPYAFLVAKINNVSSVAPAT